MSRMLDEDTANKELEKVAKDADKNQRLSWRRKMKRMEDLLGRIEPIQEEILELNLKKQPIMDEMNELRNKMVHECVHPVDYLVHKGNHIECKFCNRKLKVNNG